MDSELLLMSTQRSHPNGDLDYPAPAEPVQVPNEGKVRPALTVRLDQLQFFMPWMARKS